MGMLVTLFLITSTVYNGVDAPKSRGFSLIEIWMIGNLIPIIIAILEYGIILYLTRNHEVHEKRFKTCDQFSMVGLIVYIISFQTWFWKIYA